MIKVKIVWETSEECERAIKIAHDLREALRAKGNFAGTSQIKSKPNGRNGKYTLDVP